MGNPSSGCAPVQSPMTPLPRRRHSLSISSLPQDKLAKVHCETRASVSAVSSPARGVPLTDIQKLTAATFPTGHGRAKAHRDFSHRRAPSGAEDLLQLKRAIDHAIAGDRKTIQSFNPFRGYRRVSSPSFTPSSSTEFSSRSAPPPKNYGVAKTAGSLFQTVLAKKLERSKSLRRAASPTKTDREAITPASNMEGKRVSCDSYLPMDIDQESPRISSASTQRKIIDITNMLESKSGSNLQSVEESHRTTEAELPRSGAVSMRRSRKLTAEIGIQISPSSAHEEGRGHEEYIAALLAEDDDDNIDNFVTEETVYREMTDTGVQCSLSSEEEEYYSDASDESLVVVPSEGNSSDMEVAPHVVIRKRRRSVSASGIGAMMLNVAESAQMVGSPRRAPNAGSPEKILFGVEALRARQYVMEKTAQFSMGPHSFEERLSSANSTPARAFRPESEDVIISTYPKFADIEMDTGGHCIELVQHYSTDAQLDGAASPFQARQRSRQATPGSSQSPSHLHYQANTNCTTQQRSRQTTPGSSPSPSYLHYHTSSNYIQQRSRNATPGASSSPSHHLHYHASANSRSQQATPGSSPCPSHLHYHASGKFRSRQATPGSSPSPCYLHNHNCPVHQDTPYDQTKISPIASPIKQTEEGHSPGTPTADPSSRAQINPSYENHSLQECFKTVDDVESSADKVPLHIISRTFISRLQAPPSGAFARVDVYRPAASTVAILSNPTFSSSHQDRLWEEQADIYSSGGRGTPGRDEEPNIIINLRKSPQCYQGAEEIPRRRVEEVPRRRAEEVPRRRASPESGHFMQQFMSRVRGSMSPQRRAGLPPRPAHGLEKRRNSWSSCICFSVK